MKFLFYLLIIGLFVSSCVERTLNTIKTIVEPLPPPSMDSSLLIGDYLFVNQSDTVNTQDSLSLKNPQ
jgi:signal peptidase I